MGQDGRAIIGQVSLGENMLDVKLKSTEWWTRLPFVFTFSRLPSSCCVCFLDYHLHSHFPLVPSLIPALLYVSPPNRKGQSDREEASRFYLQSKTSGETPLFTRISQIKSARIESCQRVVWGKAGVGWGYFITAVMSPVRSTSHDLRQPSVEPRLEVF